VVLIGVGCHDDGNYLAQEVVALLDICSIAGQPLKAPAAKAENRSFSASSLIRRELRKVISPID